MEETKRKQSFKEMINEPLPLLVDFSAEWCGPCKMLAPVLKEVAAKMGDKVRIIKVDIDRNPAIADAWQIQSVPTLILFQSGSMLWRQSGVVPASHIMKIVNEKINAI